MEPDTLEARVEILERMVAGLQDLPDRMASVEGRLTSVEGRLVSVEGRLTSVEGRLTSVEGRLTSVESQIVQLRIDMNDGFSAIRAEMREGFLTQAELMDQRFAQAKHETLLLYEDLKSSIRTLGEGGFRPH